MPPGRRNALAERVWYGDDAMAQAARLALQPAERVYAGIIGLRGILYDAGWLRSLAPALPAISVGNLSVGGTGKTPVAAWLTELLIAKGAKPAVVLRGYGNDEPLVHRLLNPDVPVIASPDRIVGIRRARDLGADVAVLDDAFQHRRAQRVIDIVLVSADQWTSRQPLLPIGPWREPLDATRRASLVIVTRKVADEGRVAEVHRTLAAVAPQVPRMSVHLAPTGFVRVDGQPSGMASAPPERRPMEFIANRNVHALTGIGDPVGFLDQLRSYAAQVTATTFPDHHAFTAEEIGQFARGQSPESIAVCTLKDAVKVGSLWPREASPLWYVSQRVIVERGLGGIDPLLDELLAARQDLSP